MNKVVSSVQEAIADVEDGAVIAVPGFFTCGVPRDLLWGLVEKGVKNLTLCCGCGPLVGAKDITAALVEGGQIKKVIDSYSLNRSATKGMNDPLEIAVRNGDVELEVFPMGTLAEKYRNAGAGIPAFYTPTGVGSVLEKETLTNIPEHRQPREVRVFDGKKYILELALRPDFAFVHAHTADTEGNLKYAMTARNFNHVMAMAARTTIAEVENLVTAGGISPEDVHTSQIYVRRLVKVERPRFDIGI
jgi:3-oxoacid CoA-transferase A subunit